MMSPKTLTADPQLYVRVLENIDRAVIAVDRNGCISLFNPAAQTCTGLSERQSLGRRFDELFAGLEGLLYLVRAALSEGRSISDHENVLLSRPQRAPLPVSVSVSPLLTERGETDGAVLIIRDISRNTPRRTATHNSTRYCVGKEVDMRTAAMVLALKRIEAHYQLEGFSQ